MNALGSTAPSGPIQHIGKTPRPIQSISRDICIFCLSVCSYHWMPSLEITKPTGTLIAAACSGSGKVTISTV